MITGHSKKKITELSFPLTENLEKNMQEDMVGCNLLLTFTTATAEKTSDHRKDGSKQQCAKTRCDYYNVQKTDVTITMCRDQI